jgi:hypothetical protein
MSDNRLRLDLLYKALLGTIELREEECLHAPPCKMMGQHTSLLIVYWGYRPPFDIDNPVQ